MISISRAPLFYRLLSPRLESSPGGVMRTRAPPPQNGGVGRLAFLAGLASLGKNARRTARMPAARRAAFTAAHRVTHRIHRRTAVVRLSAQPALPACLAQTDIHVVRVADSADRRPALRAHPANFARRQRDLRPMPFAGRQCRTRPCAAAELPATAGLHLEIVNAHPERNAT